MINIQSINPFTEKYIAFDGASIIRDSDQKEIGLELEESAIEVKIIVKTLKDWSFFYMYGLLNYDIESDYWIFDISGYVETLKLFVGKCVATVIEDLDADPVIGLRTFKINEFGIYFDDMENTIIQLPYELKDDGAGLYLVWYQKGYMSDPAHILYTADVYKNGTGIERATHPSEITHRGALVLTTVS